MALIKTPDGGFYLDDNQFDVDYNKNVVTIIGGGGGGAGQDVHYTFNQRVPAEVWNIAHNMNKFPSVSIVDSGGNVVIGNIDYVDRNNVQVTFNGAFSGSAYLN